MSILIKNAENSEDLYIDGNTVEKGYTGEAEQVIDAKGMAVLPGFANMHTHAPMVLMRGYADDMELHDWLQNKIWPLEKNLKPEHVYAGAKLAVLEMLKSGTTVYTDMYYFTEQSSKACNELGIRALLTEVLFDFDQEEKKKELKEKVKQSVDGTSELVQAGLGPHAVYTVSRESLEWLVEFSEKNNLKVHLHVSETKKENDECVKKTGKRPIAYLDELGLLNNRLIAAHCVWVNQEEMKLLADKQVNVVYNPSSNMKLSVGSAFNYPEMKKQGVNVCLGTDGAASNNNLDMFEEMKFAALLQKQYYGQTVLPASEALEIATKNGYKALGMEGVSDFILVDLKKAFMCPGHNITANIAYAANGGCVDTVIVNGSIVMQKGNVKGEEEILEKAEQAAKDLVKQDG